MHNSRTEVDIKSGFPKEMVEKEKNAASKKEEERLKKQAECAWITSSDAGKKIIDLVEGELLIRAAGLIKNDPEACAYMKVLESLGIQEALAEKAVKQLVRIAMKKEKRD